MGVSSLIAFHIASLRCSESHTLWSLLMSYIGHEGERLSAPFMLARAKRTWKHPRETQEELIRELTGRHAKTEYGRRNRLGEIRSVEDLRKRHPLTTYEHYKEYIQRMADGEEGVFLDERPVRFGVTSGTTGAGKLIPLVSSSLAEDAFTYKFSRMAIYQGTNRPSSVQKRCFIYAHPRYSVAKSGIKIAPYFFFSETETFIISEHSSPPPALTISDEPTATYIHMLFAIADPNLALLWSVFTPQLYRALKVLETSWQTMLDDLSTGKISSKVSLSPDVRRSLEGYLRPDKGRVSQLRAEFEKGFEGIVRRIWPHLVAVDSIDVMGFRKRLQERYNKGVPCVSGSFGSTDCGNLAVNIWIHEEDPRYVVMPSTAIFEFIPEEQNLAEDPMTLLLDEVEVGGRYELVLTTRSGMYRYRSGDIIEVVGFHENCPVFRILYRAGEYLNLVYEKLSTQVVQSALDATLLSWPGVQLVDWTCTESSMYDSENPELLYYLLFVEVHYNDRELNITAEQRSKFDENLRLSQHIYKILRASRIISPARMHFVRPGTFMELQDFIVSRTTACFNQFKTPRKLRRREHILWMMERVIEVTEATQ